MAAGRHRGLAGHAGVLPADRAPSFGRRHPCPEGGDMTGLLGDRRFRLVAVLSALAAVGAAAALIPPRAPHHHDTRTTQRVVVGRAALGCPTIGAADGTATSIDAVAPHLPDGTPIAGGKATPLELRRLDGPTGGLALGSAPRRGQTVSVKQGATPV